MRVLFSSTSGYGHVFPMLPLARAFVAAGHDVLWATGEAACRLLDGTGVETAPAGLSGAALQEARQGVLAAAEGQAPQDRAAFVFPLMFGDAYTPPMVADLLPLATTWRPDLLIHENGELASPVVGSVLGVPSATHSFGGAIPPGTLTDAGERIESVWADHGQSLPPYAGCFTSVYLDTCPESMHSVPVDHISDRQPLRPVSDTGPAPETVPDFLAVDEPPLVYLTLGTVRNLSPVLAPAVEALSALPVRLLVTVGPDGDPEVVGSQPANVRVERWVHQPQVLEHSAVVVSHAGSGTFFGALALGLPQLCLPQAADQFRNAAAGARSGAALTFLPPDAAPDAIAGAVTRLLGEERFRRNAGAVAVEIRKMPAPDAVVDELVRRFGVPA
jgi:UDP:flavonoid glycosyltransferase YjiC (YdhE family)